MNSIEELLQSWCEAQLRELQVFRRRCEAGPPPPLLFQHVFAGFSLTAHTAAHLAECSFCTKRIELMRKLAAETAAIRTSEITPGALSDESKADTTAAHRAARLSVSLGRRWRRWALGLGGLATAALVAFVLFWHSPSPVRADIYADAAVAGSAWFRLVGSFDLVLDLDSPEGRTQLQRVAGLGREVREGLQQIKQNRLEERLITPFCQTWQSYYCLLRDLGKREDAIREVKAAVAYSRSRPDHPYLPVFLDGMGNVHAAFGEFDAARAAYRESIEVRHDDYAKFARDNPSQARRDPHWNEPGYEGHLWQSLTPMYLRLMRVAMAEGKLAEARDWQGKADRILAQQMSTAAELCAGVAERGLEEADQIPGSSGSAGSPRTMWQCWLALSREHRNPKSAYTPQELAAWPDGFSPNHILCVWVRTTLYFEALLLRAEGDYTSVQVVLDRAASVPDFPDGAEFKLPFLEGLERARLAIIRKDYSAALRAVSVARSYMLDPASRVSDAAASVNKLPLKPLDVAEMSLLEGVARLGLDQNDSEGRQAVEKALSVVRKLAAVLPSEQQEAFIEKFVPWRKLTDEVARDKQ